MFNSYGGFTKQKKRKTKKEEKKDILVIMSYLQTQTCTEDKREFVCEMEREGGGEVGRIRELASVCVIFCVQ